jgi:hypothetical protein
MRLRLQPGALVGIWLFTLWSLSPLGDQASLRLLQMQHVNE